MLSLLRSLSALPMLRSSMFPSQVLVPDWDRHMYFEVEASLLICKITCPAKSLLMNFNAGDETKQTTSY